MASLNAAINIDCPSCGQPLPTVPITTTVGRVAPNVPNGYTVKLQADLNQEWWTEVAVRHPGCVLS